MGFQDAVRTGFQKYTDRSGRATRSEFWWWFLFVVIGNVVASIIDSALFGAQGFPLVGIVFGFALLLPTICVAARRLHDRDMSGWWLLLWLVPFVGGLIILILCALEGTKGDNRFGPDPLAAP